MHIGTLTTKTYAKLGVLYRNKSSLSLLVRKRIAQQMLMPIIDYGDILPEQAPHLYHMQHLSPEIRLQKTVHGPKAQQSIRTLLLLLPCTPKLEQPTRDSHIHHQFKFFQI
ncbi:hypothetical protein FKM82_005460 [Ascaphus truei]